MIPIIQPVAMIGSPHSVVFTAKISHFEVLHHVWTCEERSRPRDINTMGMAVVLQSTTFNPTGSEEEKVALLKWSRDYIHPEMNEIMRVGRTIYGYYGRYNDQCLLGRWIENQVRIGFRLGHSVTLKRHVPEDFMSDGFPGSALLGEHSGNSEGPKSLAVYGPFTGLTSFEYRLF